MSGKRTRRIINKKRRNFRKSTVVAGTAAAISLGTGVTLHKALAAFAPDVHQLPVAHDSDGDLLAEAESASMIALLKHANELSIHPAGWMPWNYRDTLQRTDGPLTTAAPRTQTCHTS
jgi:hypothetical protein